MKTACVLFAAAWLASVVEIVGAAKPPPIGPAGRTARYTHEIETNLPGSVVKTFTVALGPIGEQAGKACQWISLEATKVNGERFRVWLLSAGYPPPTLEAAEQTTARYILQEGDAEPTEFRNRANGQAVL